MGKLARWKQLVFGKTGDAAEFGQVGSDTAGSPVNTKDPATIQALAGYLSGLFAITNSGVEAPRLEDLNSLFFIITQQLAYLMEAGTPEWLSTQEYWIGSRARIGQKVYMSLTGEGEAPNVGNNPASDAINWRDLDAYYRNAANLLGTLPLARLPTVLTGKKASTAEVADAAVKLLTAITIGGVSFDGTAPINLPGVNIAGNQNTSGNAATATNANYAASAGNAAAATKLATARNIGGVSFDGTAPINLPGVNIAGNQNTSGNAATASGVDFANGEAGIYGSETLSYGTPWVIPKGLYMMLGNGIPAGDNNIVLEIYSGSAWNSSPTISFAGLILSDGINYRLRLRYEGTTSACRYRKLA